MAGIADYGMDEAQLNSVISQTDSALSALDNLNNNVMNSTSDLGRANQSDSGVKLTGSLTQWITDFTQVHRALKELNDKAMALRTANLNTSANAAGAVR